MAGKRRPSFLKRQKEQKRTARAAEKHEARRLKKQRKLTEPEESAGPDATEMPTDLPPDQAGEAEPIDKIGEI